MQYDHLSQNGIQKVLSNAPAIVQVIDFQVKQKNGKKFYMYFIELQNRLELNDGYCRLKKCVMMPDIDITPNIKNFDIIRTQIVTLNIKDGKPAHIILDKFAVLRNDISQIIGQPINYSDYEKTKDNPKGDNTIPARKGNFNTNLNKKNSQMSNTNSISNQNKVNNNIQPQKPLNKPPLQQNYTNNRQSNSVSYSTNQQSRQPQKPQINNNNVNKLHPPLNKGPQTRHDRNHILIKQLYEGMEDWKLKVRVIFRSQVRSYVKKANGQQSQVFSFEVCDRFDSIQITVFGESAGNFGNVIELDNIYEIVGGKISKDDKKNRLKIMLNERSIINLLEDDLAIPMVDDFCVTPQKLLQKDVGTQWNVIALVKDINAVVQFVSKGGKNCRKKEIYLCDPQAQVEVPITLWFQKADLKFEKIPYAFQGISVSTYNDQKQFAASLSFNFRICKQHNYRKFITTFQKMKLQNPVHQSSNRSKPNYQLVNFYVLRQEAQKLENNNSLTMQKVCYLTQISLSSKNFYLSCPSCRKKVMDQQNGVCMSDKCGKAYQRGKYRYLLNVSLSDEIETIWGTAYDEAAQVMLTSQIDGSVLTADQYVKMNEEDLKLRIPEFLDRQMKVTIVAKKQVYNGNQKIKYGINKAVLDIDYVQETSNLTRQIEYLKGEMQQA